MRSKVVTSIREKPSEGSGAPARVDSGTARPDRTRATSCFDAVRISSGASSRPYRDTIRQAALNCASSRLVESQMHRTGSPRCRAV